MRGENDQWLLCMRVHGYVGKRHHGWRGRLRAVAQRIEPWLREVFGSHGAAMPSVSKVRC